MTHPNEETTKPEHFTEGEYKIAYDAQGPMMLMHPTLPGVAIASLTDTFIPANGFHDDRETSDWPRERNANAYLLRAAPKMYRRLQELSYALRSWERQAAFVGLDPLREVTRAEAEAIDAVLAQARGVGLEEIICKHCHTPIELIGSTWTHKEKGFLNCVPANSFVSFVAEPIEK
jgi:hypothetical protein